MCSALFFINIFFLKIYVYAFICKLSEKLKKKKKWHHNLVGPASFKVMIKTCKVLFLPITKKMLGILKLECHF